MLPPLAVTDGAAEAEAEADGVGKRGERGRRGREVGGDRRRRGRGGGARWWPRAPARRARWSCARSTSTLPAPRASTTIAPTATAMGVLLLLAPAVVVAAFASLVTPMSVGTLAALSESGLRQEGVGHRLLAVVRLVGGVRRGHGLRARLALGTTLARRPAPRILATSALLRSSA